MSKFNFSLTSVFEACRKVFNPTPEERAERERNYQIKKLAGDLNLAVHGVECVPPTKEDFMNYGMRTASAFTVLHLPYNYEPLEGEKREQRIQQISDKMRNLGVSDAQIQGIIDYAEEAKRNPRDYDIPPSF